ncbi:DUF3558 domain-containing protein [Rhodococcus sp. NPDC049939]|uniref:DUF3558 domain-containing protein n=1 Tax=Rhodococcus sp. NPDC049939 TaxID=3155511 RepID=UPI0033C7C871
MSTIAVVSLLAGCGGASVGEPAAEPVSQLTFHPCDGFGPDALAASGIDDTEPVKFEDREIPFQRWACSYFSYDPYFSVVVSSNGRLLSETENDTRLTLMEDTQIAGHRTLLHDFPGGLACVASVDFDTAVLEIMVGHKQVVVGTTEQACPLALKVARDLGPYFPERL